VIEKERQALGFRVEDYIEPAKIQDAPDIANATNKLVHSFELWEAATTLGMWRMITQSKNMMPRSVVPRRAWILVTMLAAVAAKATPTKYAQNSRAGIQGGIRVAMKLA
jgi:hypothetical protein